MTKKELPKIKKNFKSFLTEEDAKISDATFTKIAVTVTFFASEFTINMADANAYGSHSDHNDHYDHIGESNQGTVLANSGTTVKVVPELNNPNNGANSFYGVNLPSKTITSIHSNHYDHQDGNSYSVLPNWL